MNASEPPAPSNVTPVRDHSTMLFEALKVMPPPSIQTPRSQEAVANWPCEAPEMRLPVRVREPSGMATAEIARSPTPLAPPTTSDQKIELVIRWPEAPPPVRIWS